MEKRNRKAEVHENRRSSENTGILDDPESSGAKSGADSCSSIPFDDDLGFVIECWPDLSPEARDRVLSIVRESEVVHR